MKKILGLLLAAVATSLLVAASPGGAALDPGGSYSVVQLVDASGGFASLSDNFRYVLVYDSSAGSLTVRDRITGATEQYTNASDGRLSADGRYLAYLQWYPHIGYISVQIRDRVTGATWGINGVNINGRYLPLGDFQSLAMSSDGRYVAFSASPGGPWELYLWDRLTGTAEQITGRHGFGELAPTLPGNPDEWFGVGPGTFSFEPSAYGQASTLKTVSSSDALVRWVSDLHAIEVTPGADYDVSAGLETQGAAAKAWVSVNFWTAAGTYVPATIDSPQTVTGTQGPTRIAMHVHAPATAAFMRIELRFTGPGTLRAYNPSVTQTGHAIAAGAFVAAISGDGGLVGFTAGEGWPIPEGRDTANFLYDRQADTISADGLQYRFYDADGGVYLDADGRIQAISNDGRYVTYSTWDVWGSFHSPQGENVYRLDRQTGQSALLASTTPGSYLSWAISPDGHVFAFDTFGGANGIEVRDLESGAHTTMPVVGDVRQLSTDGHLLAFTTDAQLLPGDTNSSNDWYVAQYNGGGSPPPPPPATDNLAPDPGFESNPTPWYYGNGPATFSWASDQGHSVTHALKAVSTTSTLSRWISQQRAIAVQPGQTFAVSAWLKRQGTTAGYLAVNFWDANWNYVPATINTPEQGGTSDWTRVALTATAPPGAAYLRVEFRVAGLGTLWADDLLVARQ